MDFVEYMQARNAVNLNSAEDKLDWIFCLFDSDGGGSVDLNEIEVKNFNLKWFLIFLFRSDRTSSSGSVCLYGTL